MAKDLSVVPDLKVLVLEKDHTMIVVSPASIMLRCTRCGGTKYLHDYTGGPVGAVRSCRCDNAGQDVPAVSHTTQAWPYTAVVNPNGKYNP